MPAMNEPTKIPKLFVGVGASAGGIQACKALFDAAPADSGAAFIVVLHLDPTRTSHVAEILQQHTRLTVKQAEGSEHIRPDHVYVIAPNSELQLRDGVLHVTPLQETRARIELVNLLFSSLAATERERAVGVVLSGGGHDGCTGLEEIHAAGGVCIAQTPASALAASMPQAAIDTGIVDAVLEPEAIAGALAEFLSTGLRPSRSDPAGPEVDDHADEEPATGFERILELLSAAVGVDFDDYKIGTMQRRTLRRMSLKGIEAWDEYADCLAKDPAELNALYKDVLIGVTEFFRDPPVWEKLANELPALLQQNGGSGLRIWVPACGTGEEAYSLVMLAFESLPIARNRLQVYATDLNENALKAARRGVYAPEHMHNVSGELRQKYFTGSDGHLQIDRRLRDCVTFASHNILVDPPFSKMDIVSCRNLLIYLNLQAHDRLLKRLHFALKPSGLLVLGRAETVGRQAALFEDISRNCGIYRARPAQKAYDHQIVSRPTERPRGAEHGARSAALLSGLPPRESRPDRRIEQFVLNQRTPACVVVDTELQILHFYGQTQQYLLPPAGEARQDLLAWTRSGFYIQLRSATKRAIDTGQPVTTEGQIEREGEVFRVQCTVEPLARAIAADGLYLVTFRDIGGPETTQEEHTADGEPLARELEQELVETRRELLSAIEQLEAAGEEHRASHEELLSLNEELQSSNEELEASKEELESLNEELNTINRELEERNIDLRAANADLNNLFLSTGIPTIFLDGKLNIRRFTPAATEVMRIVPSDIGRSIAHVKERFDDNTAADALQVLQSLTVLSKEIWTEDGRCFLRQVQPYRNYDQDVDGVCITFADVTEQRNAAMVSDAARRYAESVIRHVRTPLLVLDAQSRIVTVNPAFRQAFGVASSVEGRRLAECEECAWSVEALESAFDQIVADHNEVRDREIEIGDRVFLVNLSLIPREQDDDLVLASFEDVTRDRRARAEAAVRQEDLTLEASRKDQWIAMLGHELRNPIGAIANGIELSRYDELDSERRAVVYKMLRRQLRQVNRLLEDLLDAGRVISGKLQIAREPTDIAQVVSGALETVGPAIRKRKHELTVEAPPVGTVWVEGDASRLTEAMTNLLSNASKYTKPGGRIGLRVQAGDDVTIIVEDTGVGIPADFMPFVFDVFSQGPQGLDRSAKGLGLGLPLVRNIVELHGGTVTAASEGAGRGSRFEVTLPRLPRRPEPLQEDETIAMQARRILVVDDERDSAATLAQLLEAQGHEAMAVRDGAAALSVAKSFEPDVVLLDLGMPEMDGYEVARRLRENGVDGLVIALTGYRRDAERERTAGIDQHLTKPIDYRRLAEILAQGE